MLMTKATMDADKLNTLYWRIIHIVEPAMLNGASINETFADRSQRLTMEATAKAKTNAIWNEIREAGLFAGHEIIPSTCKPY
jgi:hypothetical protein